MDRMCIIMCLHGISCLVSPVVSFWTQFCTDNDTSKPLLIMYGSQKKAPVIHVQLKQGLTTYIASICVVHLPSLFLNRSKGGSEGGKGGR